MQESKINIDAYVIALKLKGEDCEFGSLRNDLVPDILICGLRSNALRERLLRDQEVKRSRNLQTFVELRNSKRGK